MNRSKEKSRKSRQSETDLLLHLLADPTKLKPMEKTINVSQIDEDETAMEDGLRKKKNDDEISFDGSDSVSVKSSSSTHRHRDRLVGKSHGKLDKIIENYNGKNDSDTDTTTSNSKASSKSSSRSSVSSKSSNSNTSSVTNSVVAKKSEEKPKEEKKEPMYIPKYTNEREKKLYKMELYYALQDYAKKRKLSRDYPPSSSIEDMEDEVMIQQKIDSKEEAIVLGKEGLKQISTVLVKGNNTWDYFGLKLDGWDKQIAANINNYDVVLGRLHDKYAAYFVKMEPEFVFLWMFAGSAFSFHYAKQYVEANGLEELAKKNPELMSKIQSTIASTIETNMSSQLNKKKPDAKKPGLSHAEMYKKYMEMKANQGIDPIPEGNEEDEDPEFEKSISANIDDTINEMLRENTTFIAPPKLPLSQKQGQRLPMPPPRSSRVNELLATSNRNNTIPLSETSNIRVETVDSESAENIGSVGQGRNRPRLKVIRK